jgi:hypothetical protein
VINRLRTERELPLRVGILIDTSGSVISRLQFEQAAASVFLRHALNRDTDLAFIIGFNDHTRLMQDSSSDPDLLSQAVERLTPTELRGFSFFHFVPFALAQCSDHSIRCRLLPLESRLRKRSPLQQQECRI